MRELVFVPTIPRWNGINDLSATIYFNWSKDGLHVKCSVIDQEHNGLQTGERIWQNDSIQFTINPMNGSKWSEYTFSLTKDGAVCWSHYPPDGYKPGEVEIDFSISRKDNVTEYNFTIPPERLAFKLEHGTTFRMALLINDNDNGVRSRTMQFFEGIDGLLIPGNYGQRGFLGLLIAVKYVREKNIPYLGIDLGMQIMAIETARSLLHWQDADSTEFIQSTKHPIISLPEEQFGLASAGIMKLGNCTVTLQPNSRIATVYNAANYKIQERHRSKYSFDRRYADELSAKGLQSVAFAEDGMVEAFEWTNHPWGIGVQFHPEFVSRPSKPHPLFVAFLLAAIKYTEC